MKHEPIDLSQLPTYSAGIIEAAAHRNVQKVCDQVLHEFGLTTVQWLLVGAIYEAQGAPLRLTDLSNLVGVGLSYVTTTLNLLESKKIIARRKHEADGRAKAIEITPAFLQEIPSIESKLRDALRANIYSKASREDFQTYIKVMQQLASDKKGNTRRANYF